MTRGKSTVSRQEVDDEQTRAQRRSKAATTFASPFASSDRGSKRVHTTFYRKERQRTTQILGVRARLSSGDDVEDEASHVPVGGRSRSSSGAETTTSQRQASGGADKGCHRHDNVVVRTLTVRHG
ncbi:hypothetical protein Scep_012047 [Stephania cephalantha]|uniref:Uncharacterized protein n=1 Tax=Stephania cephalantha TaxID=152367 RepID=A0AAP0P739_9MAGN